MANIKVALVGCGAVSNSHLTAWQHIPRAKILAVCDTNSKLAARTSKEWKIPRSFTSVLEMSDFKEVTLWDICTPINTHKDLANQAMQSGFDVLIEKPMTITSKDAKEIVECQKLTHRRAGVMHNWLFEPPVIKAANMVRQGKIGDIIGVQISVLHTKDDPMTANSNHWSHQLPGGRLSEMLIHPIYLLRFFLGEIQVKSVEVSKVGEYPWMKHDEFFATFKTEKELAGTYISFNAPRNAIYIDLFGQRGVIRLDIVTATLNLLPRLAMNRLNKALDATRQSMQLLSSTFRNALTVLSNRWFDGHETCIRLFAESLVKEKEPPVTVQEGYEVVKVLEDLYTRIESL
jgi:predicted dehydrogenase